MLGERQELPVFRQHQELPVLGQQQFQRELPMFGQQQEHQDRPAFGQAFVQPPDIEEEEEVEGPLKYLVTDDFAPIKMHIVTSRIEGVPYSRIN